MFDMIEMIILYVGLFIIYENMCGLMKGVV